MTDIITDHQDVLQELEAAVKPPDVRVRMKELEPLIDAAVDSGNMSEVKRLTDEGKSLLAQESDPEYVQKMRKYYDDILAYAQPPSNLGDLAPEERLRAVKEHIRQIEEETREKVRAIIAQYKESEIAKAKQKHGITP